MDENQVLHARAHLEECVLMAAERHLGTRSICAREEFQKGRVFDIFQCHADKQQAIEHLLFMTEKVKDFIAEDRLDKSMRWLSFVQGCLWILGVLSIHDGQEQNRKH